jgi:hypothetical protein
MTLILSRRAEGIKDNDQLRMVAQVKKKIKFALEKTVLIVLCCKVLQSNPDIHTLWNIRREVLLHFFQSGKLSIFHQKRSGLWKC